MRYIKRIEVLRAICAFMIVGCHLAFVPAEHSAYGLLKSFTDLFVGVFGLTSGFLMCSQALTCDLSFKEFISRRMKRILLPYLVWSLFFIAANCLFDSLRHQPLTFEPSSAKAWANALFVGAAGPHTWFLIALFYGQLLLFGPTRFWARKDRGWVPFVLFGLCALTITGKCSGPNNAWTNIGIYHIRLLAYLAFGIALGCLYPKIQGLAARNFLAVHAVWGVCLMGSCVLFKVLTGVNGFWLAALVAVPVFIWALIGKNHQDPQGKAIRQLASVSMGIYCIHPVFTAFNYAALSRMNVAVTDTSVFGDWFVSWALAWGCATVMSRFKILRPLVM